MKPEFRMSEELEKKLTAKSEAGTVDVFAAAKAWLAKINYSRNISQTNIFLFINLLLPARYVVLILSKHSFAEYRATNRSLCTFQKYRHSCL